MQPVPLPALFPVPDELAIGVDPEAAAWAAWAQNSAAFLTRIAPGAPPVSAPRKLDLADAAGGTLAIVAGREPLLWAQRGEFIEGSEPRWISALVLPDRRPLRIEGLVHAVAWWGDIVVVVGAAELRFLKPVRTAITGP